MTAYINKLKDKAGDQQLPVTHERAVRDDNGTTLESKMQNLEGAMDKAYVASSDNGMGRITLKKNMVSGVNTLTQAMMQATNTIYVIRYDFTLGEDITIPANCVLEFDGGSIANATGNSYTISGHFSIADCHYQIFKGVSFKKDETYLGIDFIRPEWFGAKGDYDYNTGTGTDDSLAISLAIKNANLSIVNKVKLSAVTYYIATGIEITSGNILLEGVYINEREENTWNTGNDITAIRNSRLITDNDISIIKVTSTVTHPIHLYHVEFKSKTRYQGYAFEFSSTFTGPVWPVVIEGCRFVEFNYAIYINSTLAYCLHILEIKNCAFWLNKYCVYSNDDNYISNFYYHDNQSHQNARFCKIAIGQGLADIYNNNFESNLNLSGIETDSLFYIKTVSQSMIKYHSNYHEENSVKIGKIVSASTVNKGLEFFENTIINTQAFSFIQVNGAYTLVRSDITLYWTGVIYCEKYPTNVYTEGDLNVFFNDFGNIADSLSANYFSFDSPNDCNQAIFKGGILCHGKASGSQFIGTTNTCNSNSYIIIFGDFAEKSADYGPCIQTTDNANPKSVATLQRWHDYRYAARLIYVEGGLSSESLRVYIQNRVIHSAVVAMVESNQLLNITSIVKKPHNHNLITNSRISSITGMQAGDSCFVIDTGKTITWSGTAWVDATGTPV